MDQSGLSLEENLCRIASVPLAYGWAALDQPELAQTPQGKGTIQWGGAYGHNWFFDPVRDLAMAALTNTAFEGLSGAFPRELRDAVCEGLSAAQRREADE